jgi:nucleoside-diphosphate-sugar epimerase
MQEILGVNAKIRFTSKERGDVPHTHAEIARSRDEFGYNPQTRVEEGLRREARWLEEVLQETGRA